MKLTSLLSAARDTLSDPQAAARQVMALRLKAAEGFMAIAATATLATLLTALMQMILGPVADPAMQELFSRPLIMAFSQFCVMSGEAFLMFRVGRVFGGTGTFAQALSLVAWLEVVLILLQTAAMLVILILPVLAAPVGLASLFAIFYLLTHFTAALNGFASLIKTFFAILGTSVALLILVSVALLFIIPVPNV